MPGFVDHRHDRLGEIRRVIACGDPHVRGRSAGERMSGPVEPGVVEVQADPRGDAAAQCLLHRDREWTRGFGWCLLPRLAGLGQRQVFRQELLIRAKDRRHVGCTDAALVTVHQGIVRAQPQRGGERGGLLPHQVDDLGQMGTNQAEIRGALGFAPDLLAV
jgi:hypothetical protein